MNEEQYQQLHNDAFVADLHCDLALRLVYGFDIGSTDSSGHIDLKKLKKGGISLQVFACWIDSVADNKNYRATADTLIDKLTEQISRYENDIAICTSDTELNQIIASDRIAAFIAIENGIAIEHKLSNLQHFYDKSVRYLTLTHVVSSDWCISSTDTNPTFDGLTTFGEDVIREMNRLGMIIDISHSHQKTVDKILKITSDPIIASHSNVYAINPHERNLTDNQIKGIANNGGMIGINFYSEFLSAAWASVVQHIWKSQTKDYDEARMLFSIDRSKSLKAIKPVLDEIDVATRKCKVTMENVVDHIDYIVKLVGSDHVGLGSDFDGMLFPPDDLSDCSKLPLITKELLKRNYTETDIRKILGLNFRRIFKQICR